MGLRFVFRQGRYGCKIYEKAAECERAWRSCGHNSDHAPTVPQFNLRNRERRGRVAHSSRNHRKASIHPRRAGRISYRRKLQFHCYKSNSNLLRHFSVTSYTIYGNSLPAYFYKTEGIKVFIWEVKHLDFSNLWTEATSYGSRQLSQIRSSRVNVQI